MKKYTKPELSVLKLEADELLANSMSEVVDDFDTEYGSGSDLDFTQE